ncbi:signal peptidase I [Rasiella rasia]|uniref:Signal peptidase I n=1 Tax=Rasiella rasia TaxID=2744027 RepID=A0A6G6GHY2_9FLAO|nr:signal peptidase I [Rasiella rasia]QIE58196.1 signal peptidase I [Rasiella rasia]
MSWTSWLLFILIVQVIHFLGTWKLYVKAGRKAWEAGVPVYNAVVLMKIINRPWWWTILLFIPIVNLIMFPVVWVETLRSFGRNSALDTALGILTFGLYIYYINYTQDVTHIADRSLKPRTSAGEWVSSILFAVVAATIVHTYVMQPFTIPTSSLEKTLLVGDFLFVSKFHYGARVPITPLAFPMVHDTIPVVRTKSYISSPEVPYFRLPGFQKIKRNDIVVFSWPIDEFENIGPPPSGYAYKPIDKKSNYVKRCVGIPGDSLSIKNGSVYINGEPLELNDRARLQFGYQVLTNKPLNLEFVKDRYDISDIYPLNQERTAYLFHATDAALEKFRNYPDVVKVVAMSEIDSGYDQNVFPHDAQYAFNNNFFGPIYIPEAGKTVAITAESIPFYKRILEVYEGSEMGLDNKITQNGTQVLLNGQPITEYTFKMDYYWMMGDNRNNSQDARTWGYVPFNHVVGKPVFVWASFDNTNRGVFNWKPRWDRFFTTVGGNGETVSYFKFFLIALVGLFGFNYFRKKRKSAAK